MLPLGRSLLLALTCASFLASCETPKQEDRWRAGAQEIREHGSKTAPWNSVSMLAPDAREHGQRVGRQPQAAR